MRTVLTMTQGMRSAYCVTAAHAYATEGEVTIVVSDRAVLTGAVLSGSVGVIEVTPSRQVLPTNRLIKSKLRQRIVNYSRSGSEFGRWLEERARTTMWRLRYVDRAVLGGRAVRQSRAMGGVQPLLLETLNRLDQEAGIDRVVVFDVFDLPTALEFGDGREISILVR